MDLLKRLTTLPEVVRRHLTGEAQAPAAPTFSVERLEVTIPAPRVAQFGYGDDGADDGEIRFRSEVH